MLYDSGVWTGYVMFGSKHISEKDLKKIIYDQTFLVTSYSTAEAGRMNTYLVRMNQLL